MAPSVSLVLSQSPRQDPRRRGFEEQLATLLVMEDGLEVNVVPHLTQLQGDDTGVLCLEGLTAHVISLAWMEPVEAFQQLQRLGVPGRFGRTRQTPQVPTELAATHPRTVYCLDLERFESVADARQEVLRVIQEQSVQVFSIGGSPMPDRAPSTPAPLADASEVSEAPSEEPPAVVDWDDDNQLEGLVDQLDELDI